MSDRLRAAAFGPVPGLFIASQVLLEKDDAAALSVDVERAEGAKCERCWKYAALGTDPRFGTICGPCAVAVAEFLNE